LAFKNENDMKYLTLVAIILSSFFFFNSCKKDRFLEEEPIHDSFDHDDHFHLGADEEALTFKNLDELPSLKQKILGEFQAYESDESLYTNLLKGNVIKSSDLNNGTENYSIILSVQANRMYKLFASTNALGEILQFGVLEIEFDGNFLNNYFSYQAEVNNFKGTIRVGQVENYFDLMRGNDAAFNDCWNIVFNTDGPLPGGSGSGSGSSNGVITPGDEPGVVIPDGCTYQMFRTCGCRPSHPGGNNNPDCRCKKDDIYYLIITCELQQEDSGIEDRNPDFWDCVNLLNNLGILTDSDLYIQRLLACNGADDPSDTGPDNPSNDFPDTDFCANWNDYYDNCIAGNLPPNMTYLEVIQTWGNFFFSNPDAFNQIISNSGNCISTNDLDDYVPIDDIDDCTAAIDNFQALYGVQLSKFEKIAIDPSNNPGAPACADQGLYNAWALGVLTDLFEDNFGKKAPEVEETELGNSFADCFGTPDSNGDYIDCSTAGNSNFEFFLYVDQPKADTRDPFHFGLNGLSVGHTFIGIKTDYNGYDQTKYYGFYPSFDLDLSNQVGASAIGNDAHHSYDVYASFSVSCSQFNEILKTSVSASTNDYDLQNYNCTDFGITVANSIGLNILDTTSPWVYLGQQMGSSSNPGDLGEDIKTITNGNVNEVDGSAPGGTCN
jgi:hypothetical protein